MIKIAFPHKLKESRRSRTALRLARYILFRGLAVLFSVLVGVYLTVIIANMGGYMDKMRIAAIKEAAGMMVLANPQLQQLPASELRRIIDQRVELEIKRLGLDKPFFPWRSFHYLVDALSLNLGRAEHLISASGSRQVRLILLERLPPTLLLWGTGQLLLFFSGLFIALFLSQRYGSVLDRVAVAFAPTSAAPPWFYGLFLILIFAAVLRILPFGGMLDAPPPKTVLEYSLSVLKHLILPVFAVFISGIFVTIYSWRTFFLIYSSEDYVELARAKGLSSRAVERRYILRPTLPTIITNFALLLIAMWTGGIITETVFSWPGLGRLFAEAIGAGDAPIIIGEAVLYAYLLAITVFLLDIVYAIIDPRIRFGVEGKPS